MFFVIILTLLALYVLSELGAAYLDGYAFEYQVRRLQPVPEKYLTFWGHAGMHGDFWIMDPVIAYLISVHGHSWSLMGFVILFALAAFLGAALLIPLLKDSLKVKSALARDGELPLAGAMHYLYFTVGTSVMASYYLLTPKAEVSETEVLLVTALVAAHWAFGVLQPPLKVHGAIHLPAKIATGAVWLALIVFAWRLMPVLHFLH